MRVGVTKKKKKKNEKPLHSPKSAPYHDKKKNPNLANKLSVVHFHFDSFLYLVIPCICN